MFKAARLNSDRGLRAAAIPAIIREPELAFDAQQWRDPKRYSMIPHPPVSPQLVSASAIIIFAQTRANERYGDVSSTRVSQTAVTFMSPPFRLSFSSGGKRSANLLHVPGIIQIVCHYDPVALQIETIAQFGHEA
jgi:hypothetical protein